MTRLSKYFCCLTIAILAAGPGLGAPAVVQAAPVALTAPAALPDAPIGDPTAWLYLLPALGAIRIKDTATLAKKFVMRAGAAGPDYKSGVEASGADWEKGAREGAQNYRDAVTQAAADGRFEKGIAAAGAAKFMNRATTLGAQRYAPGVQASENEWARGVQPSLDALKSLDLPAKRPRGQNAGRADAVAQRLHALRVGK